MEQPSAFTWKFQRLGGLDQVTLRNAEELRHIRELDPKLWTALSCPISGLEFDPRTLALLDTDQDGRIRIPEVMAAVDWACIRLKDPSVIVAPGETMPLHAVDDANDAGQRILASARAILHTLGKPDAENLSQADVAEAAAGASKNVYNGDGIVPPLPEAEPDVRAFITDALAVMGGVMDASGEPGVNKEIAQAFTGSLKKWRAWKDSVAGAAQPLGDGTAEVWDLMGQLREKIDDYFLRCDLASFAPASTNALCGQPGDELVAPEHGLLDVSVLADMPLARVEADKPVSLTSGLNPAWREPVARLLELAKPLLREPGVLSREDWSELQRRFAPYADAVAGKPVMTKVETTVPPSSGIDKLGYERVAAILGGDVGERFNELSDKDASVPAASTDIAAVERLVLYYLHLHRLLMNFVSFYDFYSLHRKAMFQAGTLYLDGRACRLCLPVADVVRHAKLATFSQLCLVYCECRRKIRKGTEDEEQRMNIVAAITAGKADLLMEGRNGVYVDSFGNDWDATLVNIISNPISLWQSLWEPYIKFGRMVSEQFAKFATDKQKDITDSAAKKLQTLPAAATTPGTQATPQPFDIGRSVGIFAAIGLALGAIGTAVASIANALFSLTWWQFPLILVGLFILISGPSFVLAWLKLRRRTLGPVLDASGWAVNSDVPINFTLGNALTTTASLPGNAERNYTDPLRRHRQWPLLVLLLAILLGAGAVWLWFNADKLGFSVPVLFSAHEPLVRNSPPGGATLPAANATPQATAAPQKEVSVPAPEAPSAPPDVQQETQAETSAQQAVP